MNKNLHDIDALFRSALENNEELPSASLKKSLFAQLNKEEAESYKKRFLAWKRAAILLLFLLAGFILYDAGIIKPGAGHLTQKIITEKAGTGIPGKNLTHPVTTQDELIDDTREIISKNETAPAENIGDKIKKLAPSKSKEKTDYITDPAPVKKNQQDKNLLLVDELSHSGLQYPVASELKRAGGIDSLLKNNPAANTNLKRIHHFKPYWTLTGVVTYDRVNYKLDSDLPANITNIKHREVHEPSFSVALLATRQLKEKWGLQTGLIYSNTAIGISSQKMYALQDPAGDIAYKYNTSSGYVYIKPGFGSPPAFGDSLIATEAKHSLKTISIPVVINYMIGKNRFKFLPGAGLEANFITSATLETEVEDAANRETVFINKLNGSKSFYWSFVAAAELRCNVNKKLSFSIRPVLRYALSAITENNVVETFPYSFGMGLGMTHKF